MKTITILLILLPFVVRTQISGDSLVCVLVTVEQNALKGFREALVVYSEKSKRADSIEAVFPEYITILSEWRMFTDSCQRYSLLGHHYNKILQENKKSFRPILAEEWDNRERSALNLADSEVVFFKSVSLNPLSPLQMQQCNVNSPGFVMDNYCREVIRRHIDFYKLTADTNTYMKQQLRNGLKVYTIDHFGETLKTIQTAVNVMQPQVNKDLASLRKKVFATEKKYKYVHPDPDTDLDPSRRDTYSE